MSAAPSRRSRRQRPTDVDHMIASFVVTALTAMTAVAMCRVFADWRFLPTLLVMALGVHATSVLLRILRVPSTIALVVVALVFFELMSVLFYRDTLRFGIPSSDTLQLMRVDLRLVWSQFPSAVAPVPSSGGFLVAAAYGIGIVAMFSDAFAFRAYGRAEAVVPAGVLFVFTAALGTDRNRIAVAAAWFATALAVVAVLRALHGGGTESWLGRRRRAVGAALPATAMCAAVAALGAALIGPILPGAGSAPLLETRQSQSDVTTVLSPLVDIRSRLVNRASTEMFTVSSSVGRYWRITGLTEFDGQQWGLPDRVLGDADGELNPVAPDAQVVQQQITISRFGGKLVPVAFTPLTVSQRDLGWLEDTDTIVVDGDGLRQGQVINVSSDITVPSVDVLRASTTDAPPSDDLLALPDDLPSEVRTLAADVTSAATTPYDRARAIQDWFRNNFTYDLTVQSGHSDDAITSFLRIRRGYCEQFAGTFAVMARSVGLPARVAVGFTQGDLRGDGKYHVLGRHAHAWPEVWFDDVGWVAFEPTPGRGAPGNEEITGAAVAQDDRTGAAGDGTGIPAPTTTAPNVTPTTERDPLGSGGPAATTVPPRATGGSGAGGDGSGTGPFGWILLGLGALGMWAWVMPGLVRRFTRVGETPSEQVISAWHGTVGALQLAGAPSPAGCTPLEYAHTIEQEMAVDVRSLTELARFVTRAVYAPQGVGEPAALRAAVLRTHLDEAARGLMPWHTRLWARIDPRLARQRLVG